MRGKRILAGILCFVMIVTLLPIDTLAASYQVEITKMTYVSGSGLRVYWDPGSNASQIYFHVVVKVGSTVVYNNDPDDPEGCSGGLKKRTASYEQYILIPEDVLMPGEEHKVWVKGFAENDVNSAVVTEGGTGYYTVPEDEYLYVIEPEDQEFVDVDADGEQYLKVELEVSGNWTASCSADWVKLSRTKGNATTNTFNVEVAANDEDVGVERNTYIKVTCGDLSEKIYIYQLGREMTDAEKIRAAKNALEIGYASGDSEDHVTKDVSLPTKGLYGCTITWATSNSAVISKTGAVTRPSEDTEVTLTATLVNAGSSATKKFYLTVVADETQEGTIPEILDVSWSPTTIVEDAEVEYSIETNDAADTVKIYVDSYLVDTVDTFEINGTSHVFYSAIVIQNPGTRTLKVIAYCGSAASEPYTAQLEVKDVELEELDPVTITAPENYAYITEGDALVIQWRAPGNVSSVDRYIVKVWSDVRQEYCYQTETQSTSVTVPSAALPDCGEYHVVVTALKDGYESSDSQVYFTVEENTVPPLSKPAISSPSMSGLYDAGKELVFSWGKVSEASSYRYSVYDITDGEPGTELMSGDNTTGTVVISGSELLAGHVIKCTVSALADDGRESEEAFVYATIVKSDNTINISDENVVFSSNEGSKKIKLTSAVAWTATVTKGGDWITLSHASGTSGREITINVSENTGDKVRNGVIRFDNNSGTVYVSVSQGSSAAAYLEVSQTTVHMDASRGLSDEIIVESNCGWYVESDAEWLFASTYHAVYDDTFQVVVEANDTLQSRTGTLTITASGVTKTVTVIQQGAQKPTIEGFQASYSVPMGQDVDLQGIVRAQGNGILKTITIKCNNAGGEENTVRTLPVNAPVQDLSAFKFPTTDSNIFSSPGTYQFVIYASADNFSVTDNSICTFEVDVTEAVNPPSAEDRGIVKVTGTTAQLRGVITEYGNGTFISCGFHLYGKENGQTKFIKTVSQKTRPKNNSQSFWITFTGLLPETTYYYSPFIKTSEGVYEGGLIEFTTKSAVDVKDAVVVTDAINQEGLYILHCGVEEKFTVVPRSSVSGLSPDFVKVNWTAKADWPGDLSGDAAVIKYLSDDQSSVSFAGMTAGEYTLHYEVVGYQGLSYGGTIYIRVLDSEGSSTITSAVFDVKSSAFVTQYLRDVFYSDSFFGKPAEKYNHDLAKFAIAIECASFTADPQNDSADTTAEERAENILNAYERIGVDTENDVRLYHYDVPLTDRSHKVAHSIAKKNTVINGENCTIIYSIQRGAAYGGEWGSNFCLGPSGQETEGFGKAAEDVFNNIKKTVDGLTDQEKNNRIILFLTGFSRGAAVSNLAAAKLIRTAKYNGWCVSVEDIYAYTFATPMGTTHTAVSHAAYNGIHNIVNPGDVVPKVAMKDWGFGRYGQTYTFPVMSNTIYTAEMRNALASYVQELMGADEKYQYDATVGTKLGNEGDALVRKVCDIGIDRQTYSVFLQKILWIYLSCLLDECDDTTIDQYLSENYDPEEVLAAKRRAREYVTNPMGAIMNIITFCVLKGWLEHEDVPGLFNVIIEICTLGEVIKPGDDQNPGGAEMLGLLVYRALLDIDTAPIVLHFLIQKDHSTLALQHEPAVYTAWLYNLDQWTFSTYFDKFKKTTVSCPVDVYVYNTATNTLVGAIVDNQIDDTVERELGVELTVVDDVKTIITPNNGDYRIEVVPIAEGEMHITVQDGNNNLIQQYTDPIDINKDTDYIVEMTATADDEGSCRIYENGREEDLGIVCDEDGQNTFDINVNVEGNGYASGYLGVTMREYLVLSACAGEDEAFLGWYLGDTLVSTELTYSFFATQSQTYTAKFTDSKAGKGAALEAPVDPMWDGSEMIWTKPAIEPAYLSHYEVLVYYGATEQEAKAKTNNIIAYEVKWDAEFYALSDSTLQQWGEGYYHFKVRAVSSDQKFKQDSVWVEGYAPLHYTDPDTTLPAPTGLKWTNGTDVSWDWPETLPDAFSYYSVAMYYGATEAEARKKNACVFVYVAVEEYVYELRADQIEQYGDGVYMFCVVAVSKDQAVMSNSPEVWSEPLNYNRPAALPAPVEAFWTDLTMDWTKSEPVPDYMEGYQVNLYYGTTEEEALAKTTLAGTFRYALSSRVPPLTSMYVYRQYGDGYYHFAVSSSSSNLTKAFNSVWVEADEVLYYGTPEESQPPFDLRWHVDNIDEDGYITQTPGMMFWRCKPEQKKFTLGVTRNVNGQNFSVLQKKVEFDSDETREWYALDDLLFCDLESGRYYFYLIAMGNGKDIADSTTAMSPYWNYTAPQARLDTAGEVIWINGSMSWTTPESDYYYGCAYEVYYTPSLSESPICIDTGATYERMPRVSLTGLTAKYGTEGYYSFRVRVGSNDITKVRPSEWSSMSQLYSPKNGFAPLSKAQIVTVAVSDKKINATINIADEENAIAICAIYDRYGKMLCVKQAELNVGANELTFFNSLPKDAYCAKIFVLERSGAPLCEKETIQLVA